MSRDNIKLLASYLQSLSLFALAGAIIYFAYQATIISQKIPDILLSIDNTTEKIEPVLDEVNVALTLVPSILKEVEETRKLIPPILKEVEQTRKIIPPILKQVEQTRNQIPALLKESEAIRGELPAMLASADKASAAVEGVSKQVAATRPLMSDALEEVQITREAIPPMMDRADVLIEKARIAGKEASEGAVTGLFTGIIKAPFALMANAGRGITGISAEEAKNFDETDFKLIEQATLYLLNNGDLDDERKWNNTKSKNHGVIRVSRLYSEGEYSELACKTLAIELAKHDEIIKNTTRSFCKNEKDEWEFDE